MGGFRESVQEIGKSAFAGWMAATGAVGAAVSFGLEVLEHRGLAVWPWLPDVLLVVSVVAVVVAPLVAFHRLRLQFLSRLTEVEAAKAGAESLMAEAKRRYSQLREDRFEVGPGLEVLEERPVVAPHLAMPANLRAVFEYIGGEHPTHRLYVRVQLLADAPHGSVYVWTKGPIYKAHALFFRRVDGEIQGRVLQMQERRYQWVELSDGDPVAAGSELGITIDSLSPIALRRVALEPEPEPLDREAGT